MNAWLRWHRVLSPPHQHRDPNIGKGTGCLAMNSLGRATAVLWKRSWQQPEPERRVRVENRRQIHIRSNDHSGSIRLIRARRDAVLCDRRYRQNHQMTASANTPSQDVALDITRHPLNRCLSRTDFRSTIRRPRNNTSPHPHPSETAEITASQGSLQHGMDSALPSVQP